MKQNSIEDEPQTQSLDQVYEGFRDQVQYLVKKYENLLKKCKEFNHCSILIAYYTDFKQSLRQKLQQLNTSSSLYLQLRLLDQQSDMQEEFIELLEEYEEFRKPSYIQPIKQFKQYATKNVPAKKKTVKLCESVMMDDIQEIPQKQLDVIKEEFQEDLISKNQIEMKQNPDDEELKKLEQQIKIAIDLYQEALLDKAYQIMHNIFIKLTSKQAIWFQDQGYKNFYEDLEEKITILNQNITELDSGGWIIEKQSQHLTIKYKLFPDSTVTVYLDSVFSANITKLMALINEIDLYSQYVPFCQQSSMNKQLSRTCKICDIIVYFPFISDRRAIFVGEGIDRLDINGTIVFVCKSIDNNITYQEKHNIQYKKNKKLVRLIINFYIFELTPLSENKCRVRAITNSNPQVKFLPNWLIGYLARKMANELFERMEKITKNFEKSAWFAKYNENIEFYNWIDQKVQKHFELRQKQ